MVILLTGGTGYIASHTAIACIEKGHKVILFDNLSNSHVGIVKNLEVISHQTIKFIQGDVRNTELLYEVLSTNKIDTIIHFAGLKSVKEGSEEPVNYYDNNVVGTLSLLKAMMRTNIKSLVFSSSATVYGDPHYLPYDESHPTEPMNTYGRTKLQVEQILLDLYNSDNSWKIVSLRYFNPVGAHHSGLIGENPNGVPNNLMPFLAKVATRALPILSIFGDDYKTKDGTGERDYIHVMDLAEGHLLAIEYLRKNNGYFCFNLGTGTSYSVLDLLKAFEVASRVKIPYQIVARRTGDLPIYFADAQLAKKNLNWEAKRSLSDMCESVWNFQKSFTNTL